MRIYRVEYIRCMGVWRVYKAFSPESTVAYFDTLHEIIEDSKRFGFRIFVDPMPTSWLYGYAI